MKNKIFLIMSCFFIVQAIHAEEYRLYRTKCNEKQSFWSAYVSIALGAVNIGLATAFTGILYISKKFESKQMNAEAEKINAKDICQGIASFSSLFYLCALPAYATLAYLYKEEKRFAVKWNNNLEKPLLSFDSNGFSYEEIVGEPNIQYRWDDVVSVRWVTYPTIPEAGIHRKIFVRGEMGIQKIHINFAGIDMSREGADYNLWLFDQYLDEAGQKNSKKLSFWDKMLIS